MKRLLFLIAIFLALVGLARAEEKDNSKRDYGFCPKTKFVDNCLECHTKGKDFNVKETLPDAHLIYPTDKMRILGWEDKNLYGYYLLTDIDPESVKTFFWYLTKHGIKKAVIDIHSPGGGLFDAQRIVALIDNFRNSGGTVETRAIGIAASAAFYIFVAGDKGKRVVYPYSDLMWHEIRSVEGWAPKLVMPATKEDEARVFRHLQDVRNQYLSTRCKLSKDELDAKIKYKDWWMSGTQAVEFGIADGFIGIK